VNVTSLSGGDNDVSRDVIESCARRLNDSLQQVRLLDRILAEQVSDARGEPVRRPLTVIGATADCPEARMTSAGFLYLTSGWKCPRHLVLDRQRWRCASRAYIRSISTRSMCCRFVPDVTDPQQIERVDFEPCITYYRLSFRCQLFHTFSSLSDRIAYTASSARCGLFLCIC